MQERNQLVDMLKGYACFLVLLGHVIMGIRKSGLVEIPVFAFEFENFIWSFHVALFMYLSGYVYQITGKWRNKGSVSNFIGYKLLNLGIPYIVFSSIYIILNSLMSSAVNTSFEISDIFNLWKIPVAQYWYIYALFWLFVIFAIAGKWMKNWIITTIIFLFNILISIFNIDVGFLQTAISMGFVFGLGSIIDFLKIDKCKWYRKLVVIISHILFGLLLLNTDLDDMWVGSQMEACLGIFGSVALISILSKYEIIRKSLLWICKFSFPIYLLHTIFTAGIRIIFLKAGISSYLIHTLSGIVVGIFIPVIIASITKKIKILDFFFYPSKTLKTIKKNG